MKRLLTFVLTAVMLLALAAPAAADLLWEPYDNTFYTNHHDECTYLGRQYLANSADGFVTVWDAPDGSVVAGQFENGFSMWVYWVYENWGLVSIRGDEKAVEGWVDLEQMSLVYDHIAFAEEYADAITPYNGEFSGCEGGTGINFYEYPGAPEVKLQMNGPESDPGFIQSVFVDEQGLTWGFVGYWRGRLNAWFCLDDPTGFNGIPEDAGEGAEPVETFPIRPVEQAEQLPAQEPAMPAKGYIPYALVGGVVAATVGALAVFFRRKKKV